MVKKHVLLINDFHIRKEAFMPIKKEIMQYIPVLPNEIEYDKSPFKINIKRFVENVAKLEELILNVSYIENFFFILELGRNPIHLINSLVYVEELIKYFNFNEDSEVSYKIDVCRRDKYYPLHSNEIIDYIQPKIKKILPKSHIYLSDPEISLCVDIYQENVYLSCIKNKR